MAKPILLVKIDRRAMGESIDPDMLTDYLEDRIKYEYHVLVLPIADNHSMELEVFNVRDISEIDIEELKKQVKEDIEKLCHQ